MKRHSILAAIFAAIAGVFVPAVARAQSVDIVEATIDGIQKQYRQGTLDPQEVVQAYLDRIAKYDRSSTGQPNRDPACAPPGGVNACQQPLNAFMHVNERALEEARRLGAILDQDGFGEGTQPLFGIPIILKDNIATADMPTTAGSVAIGASRPASDAFIARKLREAGAIILGKGTLTEYANFIALGMPTGFSSQLRFQLFQVPGADLAKVGYGFNSYDPRIDPRPVAPVNDGRPVLATGGSSSGPGIAVGANLATVGVGTETSGSILSPSGQNSLVGIKPTLGLVSRYGIVPITADQDTAGPMARTVTDAATLLGVLAGFDPNDPATAACLTPGNCHSHYTQFLKKNALKGARIAVPQHPYWVEFGLGAARTQLMNDAIATMRSLGATVDVCEIPSQAVLNNYGTCVTTTDVTNRRNTPAGKVPPCSTVLLYGFKRDLNTYLANRSFGPGVSVSGNGIQQRTINTLADVIDFDKDTTHPSNPEVHMKYGQDIAIGADFLDISPGSVDTADYLADRALDLKLTRTCGLDILYTGVVPASCSDVITTPLPSCIGTKYDAVLFPANFGANAPARAGYPSVIVPAGFFPNGAAATLPNPQPSPFGATFSGPAFSEPKLIGFAYALEQATKDVAGHHRVPSSKVP